MPPRLIFGAGGTGTTARSFTYTWDTPEKVSDFLSVLQELNILELDSAAVYPPGNTWNAETLLGQSKAADKGFNIDSKANADRRLPHLDEERIDISISQTLGLLGVDRVRVYYAHAPDLSTALEKQARAFDLQYKAGKFEKLGLCNYTIKDMEELFAICDEKGYVKPTTARAFHAYSPVAGGFLTGKVTFALGDPESMALKRTRWRGASALPFAIDTYDDPAMHQAIWTLKEACDAVSPHILLQDAALRWLMHHSALGEGDGIIFGAKTIDQLRANVAGARAGPLPDTVRETVDGLWGSVKVKEQLRVNVSDRQKWKSKA
ncbi:NADP-dependent oxidoreductase domain-containing protein [Pseudoneurospora amorphoporcata]|uniref:NADP-dependent oxidoreductase domain-containing protein n=1 Tax=Pseudoneurospora amorphoporcata TaxID=241081 RepID=A0AAN6SJM9_9PEZI|nr:NADP-dependent oxidoreductase domain-containing protein [Pseudoneurospora amorphoporcata]